MSGMVSGAPADVQREVQKLRLELCWTRDFGKELEYQ